MKILRTTFILIGLILFNVVFAQENNLKYSLGGFIELDHYSFFKEKENFVNSRNQSTVQIELESNLSDSYSFFSAIEFRNDLSDSKRNRVYLKEVYIDLFTKKVDLRIGKQVILWGKADGFNPTSNLCPIDYSDLLDTEDEEIGIFSLNTKLYLGDWEVQGVISPTFQSSIFPSEKSRWQEETSNCIYYNGENKIADYYWQEINLSTNKIKDIQYAFRISRNFNNFDLSVSYYNGWNDIPYITNEITQVKEDTVVVCINQNFYKHTVLGTDFSLALGKYIFKGEGALFFPRKNLVDNPYFQYVIGLERTFNNVIGDKNLYVIAQWIQEIKSKKISYSGSDFNHLFQRNLMARLEVEFNRDMKFSLQGIYSLKYKDFYLRPEYTYNISDGLNLKILADLIGGIKSRGGFFSNYNDNNRIQVKLKYNF